MLDEVTDVDRLVVCRTRTEDVVGAVWPLLCPPESKEVFDVNCPAFRVPVFKEIGDVEGTLSSSTKTAGEVVVVDVDWSIFCMLLLAEPTEVLELMDDDGFVDEADDMD